MLATPMQNYNIFSFFSVCQIEYKYCLGRTLRFNCVLICGFSTILGSVLKERCS